MRSGLLRGATLVVALGGFILPLLLTYTFVAGERATARVSECRRGSEQLICRGTWVTESGDRGSGGISGLGRDDEGTTVEVRVGPLGPYANGVVGSLHVYVMSLFFILAFSGLAVTQYRAVRRARPLLKQPAAPGQVLLVSRKGARTPDRRHYATLVPVPAPPPLKSWEVRDFQGRPMFRLSRTGGKKAGMLETVVYDPSGTPQHIIRATRAGQALMLPDGTPVGHITLFPGAKRGAYEFRDVHGTVWARTALRMPEWVVRMEPGAPPPFFTLALAFAFAQRHQPRR